MPKGQRIEGVIRAAWASALLKILLKPMTKEQLEGDLRFNELTNEEDNQQTQELSCVVVRERERERELTNA